MTCVFSSELSSSCGSLGHLNVITKKYLASENALKTVKDIIRFLRKDDDCFDVRRQIGEAKVMQTDLLPMLRCYWEQTDLFDALLRLIVNLTVPTFMVYREQVPTDKAVRKHYLQMEDHLQSYKEAFTDEAIWAVLSLRLSKMLDINRSERGEQNGLIIERILILIRNVVYVPADSLEKRPDNDASIHDQVLWALHQSGMLDILLYMTGSSHEQAYYMHILEICCFLLREQKPSELANAALQRSQTEKIRDEAELLAIRHRELNEKQTNAKMCTNTRHSRFGGTFVVRSLKSISDNELICHRPLSKTELLNFDADKKKKRTPKNRLPVASSSCSRRSAFTIRLFLKEFCVEFLNAYNTVMCSVKDSLARAKAQAHDESYYLWAIRFFMEFNRAYNFDIKAVSATMSVRTFHFVQQQSENYFDLMATDKAKLRLWSRRLHLAVLAYRELLLTLCAMDRSPDGTVRESSEVIKSNVFYVPEYREFILALLVTYDELKFSDIYLKDLIETQHIFLKLFESFCARKGSVVVQKKAKGRKRKNKKATASVQAAESADLNLEDRWYGGTAQQLSVVLEGGTNFADVDAVPFDAASDVPIDDQKAEAMKKIQRRLRNGELEGAVALLRASREVWPENDSFGSSNMIPEEDFLALREIFFADLGENDPRPPQEDPNDNLEEEDEDDEEEEESEYLEGDFKFEDFSKRLPHPKIIRACGLALKNFDMNSVNTNHCIVKLLHRIAFDCKMYVMLFQVSLFQTFEKIFDAKHLPQNKELVKFATYIMRKFFKVAETNKLVFMEALFWKSTKDAYDIENGYGSYQEASRASVKLWSEEEEDELRRLFMEHQYSLNTEDVVDWIVNNLIDNTRTRRAVLKKLKEMCLLVDYKGRKKSSFSLNLPQSWDAEEEKQLQELYEKYKDTDDPLLHIMPRLATIGRPKKRIIEKMLVLGIIQDKKEVRKKRSKGTKSDGKSKTQHGFGDEGDSSDSDDSDFPHNAPASFSAAAPRRANKNSTASRNKSKKNKNGNAPAQVPRSQLVTLLLNNVESGREEALKWLKDSMSDAIEDFEDGDCEGIPLVPIMDYAESAMDDGEFQQLLKAFCVCEPFDEQETYWRIPGHLSVDTLKDYCDLIQGALDRTLVLPVNESGFIGDKSESDDENVFEKLRAMRKPSKFVSAYVSEPSQNDESLDRTLVSINESGYIGDKSESEHENAFNKLRATSKPSKNGRLSGDDLLDKLTESLALNQSVADILAKDKILEGFTSDEIEETIRPCKKSSRNIIDSDDDDSGEVSNEISQVNARFTRKKGINVIESDSENEVGENAAEMESKRTRSSSDSDVERPYAKRSRVIDSDDE